MEKFKAALNNPTPDNAMERKIIKLPEKLHKGDTISLVAPGGLPPDRFIKQIENSKEYLEKIGFTVELAIPEENSFEAVKRKNEEVLSKSNSKAILPISGGQFALNASKEIGNRISDKLFCGFSNLYPFVLNNYLSGTAVLYGQHIGFINDKAPQRESAFNIKNFWTTLTKDPMFVSKYGLSSFEQEHLATISPEGSLIVPNPYLRLPESIHPHKNDAFYIALANKEKAEGESVVVCLELIKELITGLQKINFAGKIILIDSFNSTLEEKGLYLQTFFNETNAAEAEALLFSSFTDTRFVHNLKKDDVVTFFEEIKDATNTNIAYGFPFGHSRFKTPIPLGVPTSVGFTTGTLSFKNYLRD